MTNKMKIRSLRKRAATATKNAEKRRRQAKVFENAANRYEIEATRLEALEQLKAENKRKGKPASRYGID